jgi:hypothetical protein
MRWKGVWIACGVLAVAQAVQPDRASAESDPSADLIASTSPSPEVTVLLKSACYDCHSNTTAYPWYSRITPVNFWLQHHVNEAREEFNMSEWANMTTKRRDHKIKDAMELVKNEAMPLDSYTWMHEEARLSQEQRVLLTSYFSGLKP